MINLRSTLLFAMLLLTSFFSDIYAEESLLGKEHVDVSYSNIFKEEGFSIYSSIINDNIYSQNLAADSIQTFRWKAIEFAQSGDGENASIYIEKYIKSSLHVGFVNNDVFDAISNSEEFQLVKEKYRLNFSFINLFYLFTSLIGIFIFIVLNLKKNTYNSSTTLISIFVLMHSIFILDLFFFLSNLRYSFPHTFLMSINFSFLYGPIIYFYYKKITLNYKFRAKDLLHLIPTFIIIGFVLPFYFLSPLEKLSIMLQVSEKSIHPIIDYTFIVKLTSLIVYSFLIVRIYFKKVKNDNKSPLIKIKWQKGIARLVSAYVVFYGVYGLIMVSKVIPKIDFLFHLQIVTMAFMVLYIGYKAYLSPKLFSNSFYEEQLHKYKKSGLTSGFSIDLKEKLMYLLEVDKIYRQNDISLGILSDKLDTNRHNTSQVINEHFNLNFFELINKFRIEEALEIIKNDTHKNMNIIDVAYEVGFNNKVTFNKSFKKLLSQTPSQYIASLSA
ncbi:MAG: helix-turn-helix domain-containing protein [Flavobacteriaceae bacterium]